MRYFFLKLGRGNSLVPRFLGNAVEGGSASVAVFYGTVSVADCKAGKSAPDARDFCFAGDEANRASTRIVVISKGTFYVLQPIGAVFDGPVEPNEDGKSDIPKTMPVRVLARRNVAEIPHLLASMGCNTWWIQGTFRSIGSDTGAANPLWRRWEHQLAIEMVLGSGLRPVPADLPQNPHRLLCCLSSVELETLVARICEECGFFVPAYRGGVMQDIDVVAVNDGEAALSLGDLTVAPGAALSIQVKSWQNDAPKPIPGVLLVALGLSAADRSPLAWDSVTLWAQATALHKTRTWLARSLRWLPCELGASAGLEREATDRVR